MSTTFLHQLENLPAPQQRILLDFAEYLVSKYGTQKKPAKKKNRQAGTLQGFFTYMADDFDAPLENLNKPNLVIQEGTTQAKL